MSLARLSALALLCTPAGATESATRGSLDEQVEAFLMLQLPSLSG